MIYIFLLVVLFFAWHEASDDHDDIRADVAIGHTRAWIIRAAIVSAIGAFFILFSKGSWWTLIPMLTSAAALFASVHRALLNRFMSRRLCYVRQTNHFDRLLLRVGRANAGSIAYITEAIAFAASFYFLW